MELGLNKCWLHRCSTIFSWIQAIENMDKRMKRLGSKLDLVNDKTTDMVKRTTCLHHNCGEFKRKLNELEDDLRYLTIILD